MPAQAFPRRSVAHGSQFSNFHSPVTETMPTGLRKASGGHGSSFGATSHCQLDPKDVEKFLGNEDACLQAGFDLGGTMASDNSAKTATQAGTMSGTSVRKLVFNDGIIGPDMEFGITTQKH